MHTMEGLQFCFAARNTPRSVAQNGGIVDIAIDSLEGNKYE